MSSCRGCAGWLPRLGLGYPGDSSWRSQRQGPCHTGPGKPSAGRREGGLRGSRRCHPRARSPSSAPSARDTLGLCCPQGARGPQLAGSGRAQGRKCPPPSSLCGPGEDGWGRRWLLRCPTSIPCLFRGKRTPHPKLGAEPEAPKEHPPVAQVGTLPAHLPGCRSEGRFLLVPLPIVGAESGNDRPPALAQRRARSETNPGFPGGLLAQNLPAKQEPRVQSWVGKAPWRRAWLPQYPRLENPVDRGGSQGSRTRLVAKQQEPLETTGPRLPARELRRV